MTHLEKFINNVTPLDAKHLNELVNTLNTLIDKIETSQIDIGNLNDEIQNIETLRTQLDTIKNTIDEHIENCSGGEIEFRVANGYIQWRYKGEESWINLISIDILKGADGDKGERGEKGEAGITPNITIGTVTTLEAGEQATVVNSGTKENPIFNFGIPKGEKGSGSNIALLTTEIIDGKLNLTTDKYQITTMEDNTIVVLPEVEEFVEICLFFNTTEDLTITFPQINWYKQPTITKDKINKFTFTHINGEWLGEQLFFNDPTKTPIMDGLICWLDGFDLPIGVNNKILNNSMWKNKVKDGKDAIIKTITGNEIGCIENGYFRTGNNGYVTLPSFSANSSKGLSVFIDGIINKKPTTTFDRIFTLGYATTYTTHFAMVYGVSEFGITRVFDGLSTIGVFGNVNNTIFPLPITIGATTKQAKNFSNDFTTIYKSTTDYNSIFDNNFLNAENPTTLSLGDISYGLVLIYNRELTDEEMIHNYLYSLSIERG